MIRQDDLYSTRPSSSDRLLEFGNGTELDINQARDREEAREEIASLPRMEPDGAAFIVTANRHYQRSAQPRHGVEQPFRGTEKMIHTELKKIDLPSAYSQRPLKRLSRVNRSHDCGHCERTPGPLPLKEGCLKFLRDFFRAHRMQTRIVPRLRA
jgi:hypothetical protein